MKNCRAKFGVITRAFTVTELLIALLASYAVLICAGGYLKTFQKFTYESYRTAEDRLGISQLRLYLAGKDIPLEQNGRELRFHTEDHDRYLRLVNGKVCVQDGMMIFLYGIDSLEFSFENDRFWMRYSRNKDMYETWIGFAALHE